MHLKRWTSIKWDTKCQETFDKLKELCSATPILAYADFGKPFKLLTDASVLGLGAVLYQVQDGVEKVMCYASRSLTKSETKYPVHKLEFLCLKWAITEQFYEYLYRNTFYFYTDNNPLTYVLQLPSWVQWDTDGSLAWLTITSISIIDPERAM